MYRNESINLFLHPDGSFREGQINRIEVLGNGRLTPANPKTLDAEDIQGVLEGLNGDLLTQRNSLLAEVAALIDQRDEALGDNAPLHAQVLSLQSQLDAILNPRGPDLSTAEGVREHIRAARYDRQIAGFMIAGTYFSTVRDAQGDDALTFGALAANAVAWLQEDPTLRALKPDGSFTYTARGHDPIKLSAEQIARAWACMLWYVDACYDTEFLLCENLRAHNADFGVIVEQTDDDATWPQRSFKWVPD